MQAVLVGAVLLAMTTFSGAATGAAGSPVPSPVAAGSVSVGGAGGTITWSTSGVTPSSSVPGASGQRSEAAGSALADLAWIPAVGWNGSALCFTARAVAHSTQAEASALTAAYEQTWILGVSRYPPCPSATGSPAGTRPGLSPALEAAQWWQQSGAAALPSPQPAIAPGFALAGKPAYLEARVPLTRWLSAGTPLGPLAVWASARVWVDWGDGHGWTGPYSSAGGPWPGGGVIHTWDSVGTVTVAVRATWTATWALDGASGTLTSLQTTGSLDGFPVRQLQSLRDR